MNFNVVWNKLVRRVIVAAAGSAAAMMPPAALAQDHSHGSSRPQQAVTADQQRGESALVDAVRIATERFKDVNVAIGEGYQLQFGCVSGSGDEGAMGLHFVKGPLVIDGKLEIDQPEIILYEPLPNGELRITGVDYLVDAATWDQANAGPPQLDGQLFHLFDSPNRFRLDPFYTLHVWAWKANPNGAFANWNPNVSCAAFSGSER